MKGVRRGRIVEGGDVEECNVEGHTVEVKSVEENTKLCAGSSVE